MQRWGQTSMTVVFEGTGAAPTAKDRGRAAVGGRTGEVHLRGGEWLGMTTVFKGVRVAPLQTGTRNRRATVGETAA